jgi:hypothetical protein
VEDVRRRLSGVQARWGLLGVVWDEAVWTIWDTVARDGVYYIRPGVRYQYSSLGQEE